MSLTDQSLVKAEEIEGVSRFRQLDTIHEFAAEKLAASGEQAEIEHRHAAFFLTLVERAAPELSGADQRRWLGVLEREHDNIRAAMDRATANADASTAIGIGFGMWRYWQKRGHLAEARRRLAAIANLTWSRDDPRLRARLMEALGGVGWWVGDAELLERSYAEALRIWQEIGSRKEIANALYNHAFSYAVSVDVENADPDGTGFAEQHEALRIYREIGDVRGEANVLWGLGNYAYFRRGAADAIPRFREALALFRQIGDRTMEAWSLHMLGSSNVRVGEVDEGDANLQEALRLFHASGDVAGITLVLDDLASVAVAHGDLPRAARMWGSARALSSAGAIGLADLVEQQFEMSARPNVRNVLSSAELERFALEGRAMSLDETVAYALDMPVAEVPGPHEHAGRAPR